jgi:hypothetical protein
MKGTPMKHPDFITLTEKHVGGKVIRAFGKRWRLGFRVHPEDVGRRVYRTADGGIFIQDACDSDSHPSIFEICQYLSVDLLQETSDNTFALGQRPDDGITPWFETIDELELFCDENLSTFRQHVRVM